MLLRADEVWILMIGDVDRDRFERSRDRAERDVASLVTTALALIQPRQPRLEFVRFPSAF